MRRPLAPPWLALLLLMAASPASAIEIGENIEIHGEFSSYAYFRSPNFDLSREFQMSSWQNTLELEILWRLRDTGNFRAEFTAVLNPGYDAAYDLYPKNFGERTDGGVRGTGNLISQSLGIKGSRFPGRGACIRGEFCLGTTRPAVSAGDRTNDAIASRRREDRQDRHAAFGGTRSGTARRHDDRASRPSRRRVHGVSDLPGPEASGPDF